MAARDGMTNLIAELRGLTAAGTADYSLGTVSYWTDDHLQNALDRFRKDIHRESLTPVYSYNGGNVEYKEYRSRFKNLESGTAAFDIELSTGTNAGTADYSVDYTRGVVTFSADQGGTAWYLNARSYDLNASAAYVWRQKAAHVSSYYDVSTDGHSLKRSQMTKHFNDMAIYYEGMTSPESVELYRSDM